MRRWRVGLVIGVCYLTLFTKVQAQEPTLDFPVESMIRLTGILQLGKQPETSAYPVFVVWLGEQTGQFHVTHVEPVIPEYPAEEELRRVSGLGLRLLAEKAERTALQDSQMQGRPIVIEGQLHVQQGSLNVRSVREASVSPEKGSAHP